MQKKLLHIALREVINQFGMNILTDIRLVNILLDYGAFIDTPASKVILKQMINDGYCIKICNMGKAKYSAISLYNEQQWHKPEGGEWKCKLASFSTDISNNNGFERNLVNYVIECIVFGLSWSENEPNFTANKSNTPAMKSLGSNDTEQPPHIISSGRNRNKTNSVSYNKIEDTQFLVMNISPKNAQVYINGEQQFVSNGIMATELRIGDHRYEVKADSYISKKGSFVIEKSDKTIINVSLELEKFKTQLIIKAADSDADIFIDGIFYGKGRFAALLDAGTYEIELTKPKYYSYKEVIVAGVNKIEMLSIPPLKPIVGNIKINVQPYGSKIFINREKIGTSPLLVTGIQIGERIIRVISEEGTGYSTSVEVKENQVTDVNHVIPTLFIDDYSQVRIGDYYYEDGSISHEIAKNKKAVGRGFSLETSEAEKRHGWTHGQIIALRDAKSYDIKTDTWGVVTSSILAYANSEPNGIKDKDYGYEVSHLDCVINNSEFVPFTIAAKYDATLPNGKTTGWYLPSIVQWKIFEENTHKNWGYLWANLGLLGICGCKEYATSSILDAKSAWVYITGIDNTSNLKRIKSGWRKVNIRSVAAF